MSSELYSTEVVIKYKKEFFKHGILLKTLKTGKNLVMFFTYDFMWIRKILDDSLVLAYLSGKNYPVEKGTFAIMNELFRRLKVQKNFLTRLEFF